MNTSTNWGHHFKYQDYNFRAYAIRRTKLGFRENRNIKNESLYEEFNKGLQQLEMLKR